MRRQAALLGALLWGLGCGGGAQGPADDVDLAPADFGHAECATCGMVVRERPAPRAQLIHRDGTRAHFCSVGDMLTYVEAPSPHGKPARLFVELGGAGQKAGRWLNAEAAHYVIGVERPGVMGLPTFVFEGAGEASTGAKQRGGRAVEWPALKAAARARQAAR